MSKLDDMTKLYDDLVLPCRKCEIAVGIKNKVFGDGPVNAKMVIVGEAPGSEEDACGHPFVGPAGKLLDRILAEAGINRTDVFVVNAVKCIPSSMGKIRTPTDREIEACREFLRQQVMAIAPKVIVPMGNVALAATTFKPLKECKITSVAGLSEKGKKAWYVYTYHPSYALRRGNDVTIINEMIGSFKKALTIQKEEEAKDA